MVDIVDLTNVRTRPKGKRLDQGVKLRGADKMARIPIRILPTEKADMLKKPPWLRVRMGSNSEVRRIKAKLREHKLSSVCEEASCPNIGECFSKGTATFMIMGDICTRRCPFCDVAHGRPNSLNENEPRELAEAITEMGLKYVVITSVDRDDLRDGGAQHIANCIIETRKRSTTLQIETLVPDFRGRMDKAIEILAMYPPDVFNHNMETVERLFKKVNPGSSYKGSLELLRRYKEAMPHIRTKSGIIVGVGETNEEVVQVLKDLRAHNVNMVTLGQYMQPSRNHLPVDRYVTPDEFNEFSRVAKELGFDHVASGPLVRSSYHADLQASGISIV